MSDGDCILVCVRRAEEYVRRVLSRERPAWISKRRLRDIVFSTLIELEKYEKGVYNHAMKVLYEHLRRLFHILEENDNSLIIIGEADGE